MSDATTAAGPGGSGGTEVEMRNLGALAVPFDVQVAYADGTVSAAFTSRPEVA